MSEVDVEDVFCVFVFFLLFGLRRILQISLLVEESVGSTQHDKLGASVQLVAYFLMLFGLLGDKLGGEHVAFLEPWIFLGHLLAYGLRLFPSVTSWREPVFGYAVGDEIVDYSLSPSLREALIVFGTSLIVAMGSQLNGYIRVLLEQRCELVESLGAGRCKGGFVEIVEDVVDKNRL